MTDVDRFTNYTIIPASFGTAENIGNTVKYAISGDTQGKDSYLAEKGVSKWKTELKYEVAPFGQTNKEIRKALYGGSSKKETRLIR